MNCWHSVVWNHCKKDHSICNGVSDRRRADKDSYPHDRLADKDSYPHDRLADKDSYRHDGRADILSLARPRMISIL